MTAQAKIRARELVQARLEALSPEEYETKSVVACSNVRVVLEELMQLKTVRTALLYQASKKWREVDLSPLEAVFPDVQFGYVPISASAPLPSTKFDAVFVPLYGFNFEGYRLGHGTGWYDRFLATQPEAYKVGVGLEVSRVNFAPEKHDIPMSWIVTEAGIKH